MRKSSDVESELCFAGDKLLVSLVRTTRGGRGGFSSQDSYQPPGETGRKPEYPLSVYNENIEPEASLTDFAFTHPLIHSG